MTTRVTIDLTSDEMLALGYAMAAGQTQALAEDKPRLALRIISVMTKIWESNAKLEKGIGGRPKAGA